MAFDPNSHLIKIKTKRGLKDYLNVQARLMWFRDVHPHGVITTQLAHLDLDRQIAVFHAHVEDGEGGIGEGYGSESVNDFLDYIEKASTKAIGRALLVLGFGTCFAGDELDEDQRVVDAPAKPALKPVPALPEKQDEDTEARIGQVRAIFDKMFKPDRWDSFKQHHLGLPVSDDGLSLKELDKLYMALMDAKQQAKAS